MIDMVKYADDLLKTVASVQKLPDNVCPDCLLEMEEIDRKGYKVFNGDRDSEPEYITTDIIYQCRECGKIVTINQ